MIKFKIGDLVKPTPNWHSQKTWLKNQHIHIGIILNDTLGYYDIMWVTTNGSLIIMKYGYVGMSNQLNEDS